VDVIKCNGCNGASWVIMLIVVVDGNCFAFPINTVHILMAVTLYCLNELLRHNYNNRIIITAEQLIAVK